MEATIVWEEQGCRTPLGGGASGQGFRVNVSLCGSLQGGVDDEVTLSAYITIALLEIPLPITVRTHTHKVPFMSSPGSAASPLPHSLYPAES